MLIKRVRRNFYSEEHLCRDDKFIGFLDIYLGNKIIIYFNYYNWDPSTTFYINCDYLNKDYHNQIQSILDYICFRYVDPKVYFKDTIDLIEIIEDDNFEKEIETIMYDMKKLIDIEVGGDFKIHPSISQCEGYLSKDKSGKIIFDINDFGIILDTEPLNSCIIITREIYLNKYKLLKYESENSVSINLSSEKMDIFLWEKRELVKIVKNIDIKRYTEDIYNLIKFVLDYFDKYDNKPIKIDTLNSYIKFSKESLEYLFKLHYRQNIVCENIGNKNTEIKYGKIDYDENGKYVLISIDNILCY